MYKQCKYDCRIRFAELILFYVFFILRRVQRVAGLRENRVQHDRKVRNLRHIRHRLIIQSGIVSHYHQVSLNCIVS